MLDVLVTIIHVGVALFMILVVLVQGGNSGGIGAALGGGNSSGVFGAAGATSFLGKLTYIAAAIFMVTSLTLTIRTSKLGHTGLIDKAASGVQSTIPATTEPAPVTEQQVPATTEQAPVQQPANP